MAGAAEMLEGYERRVAGGQELPPELAQSIFRMSELDDLAEHRGRIDRLLARNSHLAAKPLTEAQQRFYTRAVALGYHEHEARNIAREAAPTRR